MKSAKFSWQNLIWFLAGAGICYFFLQYQLLVINYEVNVLELIISLSTIFVGIYIALTIQGKLAKSQNRFMYLETKIDDLWGKFHSFSGTIIFSDTIQLSTISSYSNSAIHSAQFLTDILTTFGRNCSVIKSLVIKLEDLQTILESQEISNNVITLTTKKSDIKIKIEAINLEFSQLLKEVHEIS